jgi:hypothetical protein
MIGKILLLLECGDRKLFVNDGTLRTEGMLKPLRYDGDTNAVIKRRHCNIWLALLPIPSCIETLLRLLALWLVNVKGRFVLILLTIWKRSTTNQRCYDGGNTNLMVKIVFFFKNFSCSD